MKNQNVLYTDMKIRYSCTLDFYVHLVSCKAVEMQVHDQCFYTVAPGQYLVV